MLIQMRGGGVVDSTSVGCSFSKTPLPRLVHRKFVVPPNRGLHSSTLRLNVSTFCGIYWVASVTQTAQIEVRSGRAAGADTPPLFG